MWRSDDPTVDAGTIKRLSRLAVKFADANALPAWVVYGENESDPAGLIRLLTEVFFVGRACGARAVSHLLDGSPIPLDTPDRPFALIDLPACFVPIDDDEELTEDEEGALRDLLRVEMRSRGLLN